MSDENRIIMRRWFQEVWNENRDATIDELFSRDGVAHGLGEAEDVYGPAHFRSFAGVLRDSIPDIQIRIDDEIAEGDRVAVRVTLTGTYSGRGLGGSAPAGTKIHVEGIIIGRYANGQMIEAWNSWDQLGFLRQIGALGRSETPDTFLHATD